MISASHNSFEDNGVKLFAPGGQKMTDALEQRSRGGAPRARGQLTRSRAGRTATSASPGPCATPIDEYVTHVVAPLEGPQPRGRCSVVLDCGNGAAFRTAPKIFRELGATVECSTPRPTARNINADCGSTDPAQLQQAVLDRRRAGRARVRRRRRPGRSRSTSAAGSSTATRSWPSAPSTSPSATGSATAPSSRR